MKQIKGFLLDIDGTLLNSTPVHLNAWRRALIQEGVDKSDHEITAEFGKSTLVIAQNLSGFNQEAEILKLASRKTEYYLDEIGPKYLYPRVGQVIEEILRHGGKIVYVSSNFRSVISNIITKCGWDKTHKGFVGIEDVVHTKPDPQMLDIGLEYLQTEPGESVIIGDSVYDIIAGQRAGVKTVGVCTKILKERWDQAVKTLPDLVIPSFGDLRGKIPLFI